MYICNSWLRSLTHTPHHTTPHSKYLPCRSLAESYFGSVVPFSEWNSCVVSFRPSDWIDQSRSIQFGLKIFTAALAPRFMSLLCGHVKLHRLRADLNSDLVHFIIHPTAVINENSSTDSRISPSRHVWQWNVCVCEQLFSQHKTNHI